MSPVYDEPTFSDRGFAQYAHFKDTYGFDVKVAESSAATEECVWIFIDSKATNSHAAAHLNFSQAKAIRDSLNDWIAAHVPDEPADTTKFFDLDAIEADFVKWSEEPFDDMGMAGFGAKYGAALIAEVKRLRARQVIYHSPLQPGSCLTDVYDCCRDKESMR